MAPLHPDAQSPGRCFSSPIIPDARASPQASAHPPSHHSVSSSGTTPTAPWPPVYSVCPSVQVPSIPYPARCFIAHPHLTSPAAMDAPGGQGPGVSSSLLSRQLLEQSREHCRQDTLRPALRRCQKPGAPFACPRFPPILHCRVTGSEERGAQTLGENTPSVQGTPGL